MEGTGMCNVHKLLFNGLTFVLQFNKLCNNYKLFVAKASI